MTTYYLPNLNNIFNNVNINLKLITFMDYPGKQSVI